MKLGELITKAKVERCGNRNFPVYSMTMHDGIVEQAGRFKKAIASKDTSSYKVVTKNQLVVGFPIDEGVIYVQNHDEPGIMSPAYSVWDFDQSRLNPAYLELALHSPQSMAYYADKMRGTTARRRSLTADGLRALTIPLPSMDKQLEIVAVLRGIKAQISYAQDQMSKLDQLVKSRFVEMFGDPISNSKQLDTKPGSALFKIGNGKSKPASERYEVGIPAYGGNGISWYSKECLVDDPTIVIGRVGRHCGNTRLVNEPCWVTDNAMYIKRFLDDGLDLIYLDELMRLIGFNRYADKGDLWKITQQPFMDFAYPMPPLEDQRRFSSFVAQVDKPRFARNRMRSKKLWATHIIVS